MSPDHLTAITNIQPHQDEIGRTRQQFQNLRRVEHAVELPRLCLVAEKDSGRNEHQHPIGTDDGHTTTLGDQDGESALSTHGKSGCTGNCHAGNECDKRKGNRNLYASYRGMVEE